MNIVAFAVAFVCASGRFAAAGSAPKLDKDREAVSFDLESPRKAGRVYVDDIEMHVSSEIAMAGQHFQTIVDMHLTSEMSVQDLAQGGQSVDATVTSVSMDMDTAGMHVTCDSEHPDGASAAPCKEIMDLMESTQHFILDDQGTVASSDQPAREQQQQISPLNQLQQQSRLLQLLPNYPAKPDDVWEVDVDLGDDMGQLKGDATLLGYTPYKGYDCAVISIQGTLRISVEKIVAKMGKVPGMQDISVGDIDFHSKLYWDVEEQLARWSAFTEEFEMHMKNPLDRSDMRVPVIERVTTKTDIKQ